MSPTLAEPEVLAADSLVESSVDVESAEPQTAPASDADDVESEPEDESVIEAETVSTGVSVETAADAEDELIDEDHDPIGEEELEGLSDGYAPSAPLSEQEESLETTDDDGELVTEEAEVVSEPDPLKSSEMIVVYASEPVSDEIVYVQSEAPRRTTARRRSTPRLARTAPLTLTVDLRRCRGDRR